MLIVPSEDQPSPSQHRLFQQAQFCQVGMVPISGRGKEEEEIDSEDKEHAESEDNNNYPQISSSDCLESESSS